MNSPSELMRHTLLILEAAGSTTPCDWDEQNNMFLFTQQDQDLFLSARGVHTTHVQEKQAEMASAIKQELGNMPIQLRTRLPAPHVFGIVLNNPEQKQEAQNELSLSVFQHKPKPEKQPTAYDWDPSQNMMLFTQADLQQFLKNWNVHVAVDDPVTGVTTQARLTMRAILEKHGVHIDQTQTDKTRFVLRVAPPYYMGLKLAHADLKPKVSHVLALRSR